MRNGLRPDPFSLGTKDEAEAILKVMEWRRSPELQRADALELELEAYVRDQVENEKLTEGYAAERKRVILRFAKHYGVNSA